MEVFDKYSLAFSGSSRILNNSSISSATFEVKTSWIDSWSLDQTKHSFIFSAFYVPTALINYLNFFSTLLTFLTGYPVIY